MSLTALRNLATTDFASGSGITASTLRTVISAILDVFSKNITYSASIPFNCGASNMGQQILSANTVFTVNSTDATPGMCTILRLQGDGTHTPDLTAFKVIEGTYVNTSGTNNLLLFCFDGTDYTVAIKQIPSAGGTGAGDTTPPVLTGISVLNSAPSQVVLQYSETLGAVTPATGDFSFPTGGGTISSVVISGSQVLLNLSSPIGSGTTNTLTYTPGTNKIQDTSGNLAASFTAHSITNSVGGGTAPSVIGINVHDATSIDVGFDMSVTGGLGGWSFTKNGSAYAAASISSPASATLRFTFSSSMIGGDVLLASYNSGTGNTQNGSSVPLASFTNHAVTNGLSGSTTATLPANSGYTLTSNRYTVTGGGTAWGNTGVSDQYCPSAVDTIIYLQYISGDADGFLGLQDINLGIPFANIKACFRITAGTLETRESGASTARGSAVVNTYYGLKRIGSTGIITLVSSTDQTTWTTIATLGYTNAGNLYIVSDINGAGAISNLKGIGIANIPTVAGAAGIDMPFATNTGLTNTAQVITPTTNTGSYGNTGLDAKSLAASTSGRIWQKNTGGNSAILGFSPVNAQNTYTSANFKAGFYFAPPASTPNGDIFKIESGSPSDLIGQAGKTYYYGLYRDGSTGVVKLIRSADALNWMDCNISYTFNSTAQLFLVCDLFGGAATKLDHPQGNSIT